MHSLKLHSIADLIDIGWEAPAGQLFSTTNDLAKFMSLIFQPEAAIDPTSGQVGGNHSYDVVSMEYPDCRRRDTERMDECCLHISRWDRVWPSLGDVPLCKLYTENQSRSSEWLHQRVSHGGMKTTVLLYRTGN